MSVGTKIDSLLEIIVNDIAALFESQFENIRTTAVELDKFSDIRPLLSICKGNPRQVIGAAAFSELICMTLRAAFADKHLQDDEADVSKDIFSACIYRYSWRDHNKYGQFSPFANRSQVLDLMCTWSKDQSLLGGDFQNGAILFPCHEMVIISSIVTRDMTLYDRFTQIMLLVIRLVLETGGVTQSENDLFMKQKKRYDDERLLLVQSLRPGSDNPACPSPQGLSVASHEDELSPDQVLREALAELKNLVGLSEVKAEISRLANFLKVQNHRKEAGLPVPTQSLHFVFTGNPGTGKTTVARIVSRLLYGFGMLKTPTLVEADRASLVGGYVGQTAIKTSDVVGKSINGVLFIDEAYTLSKKDSGTDYGQEAIDTILKKMEDNRGELVVIVAGYPDLMSQFLATNPGLESRFTRFVRFEDYHVAELCQIFERMCQANSYSLTQEAMANLAILFNRAYTQRERNFGNARFVRNAYEQTLGNHADRLANFEGDFSKELLVTIEASDLPFNLVSGIQEPIDVKASRWMTQCPGCSKAAEAGITYLGKRIRCKCGKTFIFPTWNLNPASLPSLTGFEVFKRPGDLIGLEAPPKSATNANDKPSGSGISEEN
jgi:AAA+ superfamily predicted ATPase